MAFRSDLGSWSIFRINPVTLMIVQNVRNSSRSKEKSYYVANRIFNSCPYCYIWKTFETNSQKNHRRLVLKTKQLKQPYKLYMPNKWSWIVWKFKDLYINVKTQPKLWWRMRRDEQQKKRVKSKERRMCGASNRL